MAGPASGFTYPTVLLALSELPTVSTPAFTSATKRLMTIFVSNTTTADLTVSATNTAGVYLFKDMVVPANMPVPVPISSFMQVVGLNLWASGAGVMAQVEGY